MEFIQQEINEHKTKLKSLITNLINTQLINEEIFINNEIKKESENIVSLLNVKQNILMDQINKNNNINFNPLMFQPNQMMMNIPVINMNQMQQQSISNNFNNFGENNTMMINVYFEYNTKITTLFCNPYEKISEVIKKYREKAKDFNENWFKFNNKELEPSLTLSEFGIVNNSKIIVIRKGIVKGAKMY